MKDLKAVLQDLGGRNVRLHIQSGNAVFESADADRARLAKRITAEIARRHGFEPAVMLLGVEELETAVRQNPFPEAAADPRYLHLGFLAAPPSKPDQARLEALKKKTERFEIIGRFFYLHAPEGVGRSKLAAGAERALGVPMTLRNWRTVTKVLDLARQ